MGFTFLLLYIEGFCIAHIWKYLHDQITENNKKSSAQKRDHIAAYSLCDLIISLYLIIYGAVCLAFVLGLLFYHTNLVLTNATTKEMLKNLWDNPFGNGFNRSKRYNIDNTLLPEIKKYSILDILRCGKSNDFNYKEFEKLKFLQQEFNYKNRNNNNYFNNNNNNNNNNLRNNNNNSNSNNNKSGGFFSNLFSSNSNNNNNNNNNNKSIGGGFFGFFNKNNSNNNNNNNNNNYNNNSSTSTQNDKYSNKYGGQYASLFGAKK